jgi:hypothetical protein
LRAATGVGEGGVARVQMREVRDLVGAERATDAGVVGPAVDAGIVEGAIEDELAAAFEEIEQRTLPFRTFEDVLLFDREPGHAAARRSHRIARVG